MEELHFIADRTVGRLAKWLRLAGFDCEFWRSADLQGLIRKSNLENRYILTKNTKLPEQKGAEKVIFIKSDQALIQLKQIIKEHNLSIECEKLLSICSVCNVPVEDVSREDLRGVVPPYVFAQRRTYRRCPQCSRIYWAGTHKDRILKKLMEVLDSESGSG